MIRRLVVLPAGPERVWAALTDPDQADAWFGGQIDWDVQEGAELTVREEDGRVRYGRIDAVRPGRYLRYTWWDEDGEDASEVSYLLEPEDDGTRLTIQERGIESGPAGASAQAARAGAAGAIGAPFSWSRWDDRMAGAWVTLAGRERARA